VRTRSGRVVLDTGHDVFCIGTDESCPDPEETRSGRDVFLAGRDKPWPGSCEMTLTRTQSGLVSSGPILVASRPIRETSRCVLTSRRTALQTARPGPKTDGPMREPNRSMRSGGVPLRWSGNPTLAAWPERRAPPSRASSRSDPVRCGCPHGSPVACRQSEKEERVVILGK
jgi:hypothetical protein